MPDEVTTTQNSLSVVRRILVSKPMAVKVSVPSVDETPVDETPDETPTKLLSTKLCRRRNSVDETRHSRAGL
jgi:hypothetical protein